MLAWLEVEETALAEVLLAIVAVEDTELADELRLTETLDDEAMEALLDTIEEPIELLDSEEAAEELVLEGRP